MGGVTFPDEAESEQHLDYCSHSTSIKIISFPESYSACPLETLNPVIEKNVPHSQSDYNAALMFFMGITSQIFQLSSTDTT